MMNSTTLQESYVFISYPRSEEVFVKRLVQDLRAHGFQVWRDETNIDPGSPDWEAAIRDAIHNAYAIVLIASPNVTKSLYIKGELNLAKRYHPNRIYPIWIRGTEWSDCVPIDFINTQYIDIRGENYAIGLNSLVKVLSKAREQLSLNATAPQAPMPVLDRLASTYPARPGNQLSELNTGVDSKSVRNPYTPSDTYAAPLPPPLSRRLSARKTVLLIALVLLIVGTGGALYSQLHASPKTQPLPVTSTPSAQALYAQITKGTPVLDDPLRTNGSNKWEETTSGGGKFSCMFSGGFYHTSATYTPCLAQATNFGDLAYQVQMTIVNGDWGGIVFRADSSLTKYYSFFIDRFKNYTLITSVGNGKIDRTLRSDTSAFIKTDLNQANLLTVIARGSSIYLYINQQYITSASDTTYRAGQIGVFGGYKNQAPADVVFSHAQVWKI